MFGFSTVGFLMAFYFAASALATLLVVAACIASGNASQESEQLFARHMVEKRSLAATTTAGSQSLPSADHRFLPTSEDEVKGKSKNESVQTSDEQAMMEESVRV